MEKKTFTNLEKIEQIETERRVIEIIKKDQGYNILNTYK